MAFLFGLGKENALVDAFFGGTDSVIAAWCYSERAQIILKALGLI